jgi:hypothetical protein
VYWAKRKEEEVEKLARDEERRVATQKAKRHVGRPKMKRQPDVVLISPVEEVEVEEPVATQPPTKKSRCGGRLFEVGQPRFVASHCPSCCIASTIIHRRSQPLVTHQEAWQNWKPI